MLKLPIYFDHNATTPVDDRVLEKMLPYFSQKYGNAASKTHAFGWVAAQAVDTAREQVAALINAKPNELIFTGGSTEAINMALKGIAETYTKKGSHFVTVKTEHKAVLDTFEYLSKKGSSVTYLDVDREGIIDLQELKKAITPQTIAVCIMYANNETGVVQPIKEISAIVHEAGSLFVCDATQAVGKIPVDVEADGIDVLCLSAHKFYGPKGVGALYVRKKNPRVVLSPLIHGGGHEQGLRSGTLNVPAIVGLGAAAEIAGAEWIDYGLHTSRLRTILEQHLTESGNAFINGSIKNRLPNTTNISFVNVKADSIISKIPDLAVSTGSACTSAIATPSHVLKAMGLTDELAYGSIRFSLGKYNTEDEVRLAIKIITDLFQKD